MKIENYGYAPVIGCANERNLVDAEVSPVGFMEMLSRSEQKKLLNRNTATGLHEIFRRCCLAVLNCGGIEDAPGGLMEKYPDFDVSIVQRERGIKLLLKNAPSSAFVDGVLIRGIQENLFAVIRDILFGSAEFEKLDELPELLRPSLTDTVFHMLRNAKALEPGAPNIVVCWGGHSIQENEYRYTKLVGYELGLRGMDICTGCGPGAMKGPMKGASLGHAKQHGAIGGRYFGFTEPGIIAVESPNPIVNQLVIMPDIEKRLEAFVRAGHGIVVFPGGVGTAEEILYILGVLLHPKNEGQPLPLVFTGPKESAPYFQKIHEFIADTLGEKACERFQIVIDDPEKVARIMKAGLDEVRLHRKETRDAYYFNWSLHIEQDLQLPFEPSHENMEALDLHKDQPIWTLAAQLRRAFSGIVAGNVKHDGVEAVKKHGPFRINGDAQIMEHMDKLLESFVAQNRMKLPGSKYIPCYKINSSVESI